MTDANGRTRSLDPSEIAQIALQPNVTLDSDKNEEYWSLLLDDIRRISFALYSERAPILVKKLQRIVSSDSITYVYCDTVMVLLYENCLQAVACKDHPIGAMLFHDFDMTTVVKLQHIVTKHRLQFRLRIQNLEILVGADAGVVSFLYQCFVLNPAAASLVGSSVFFQEILPEVSNYSRLCSPHMWNDTLVQVLYSVLLYFTKNNISNANTKTCVQHLRQYLIYPRLHPHSVFANMLAVDIIEYVACNGSSVADLFPITYRKIFAAQQFVLQGVREILKRTPYPKFKEISYNSTSLSSLEEIYSDNDCVFESNDRPSELPMNCDSLQVGSEPDGQYHSDKGVFGGVHTGIEDNVQKYVQSSSEEHFLSNGGSVNGWTGQNDEVLEEVITVPERCVGRVVGYEGAIIRRLEIQSKANIQMSKRLLQADEKPEKSMLTAHLLVIGALGVRSNLSRDQLEAEKEKLLSAKVRKVNQPKVEPQRELVISGSASQISIAKSLIYDIINNTVSVTASLLDLTLPQILDKYEKKLKTVETLLNVYFQFEEQDDGKVLLCITGDSKSCQDAKKLVFEELGQLEAKEGYLFPVPEHMMKAVRDEAGLQRVCSKIKQASGATYALVHGSDGWSVFLSGNSQSATKALQMFRQLNVNIIMTLSEIADNGGLAGREITLDEVCEIGNSLTPLRRSSSSERPQRPSLSAARKPSHEDAPTNVHVQMRSYDRDTLVKIGRSCIPIPFPPALDRTYRDDVATRDVILRQGLGSSLFEEILRKLYIHDMGGCNEEFVDSRINSISKRE